MNIPKAYVVIFPGSNCDRELFSALRKAGFDAQELWHRQTKIPADCNLVCLPGGFAYGDYLRAGAVASISPIMEAIKAYAHKGGHVLGICNGFQALCESQLLPGALIRNKDSRFIHAKVELEVCNNKSLFSRNYQKNQRIHLPIAHANGNYYCDGNTLKELEANDQIILRYTSDINGSLKGIAGIVNKGGNVFGLMPHPERAVEAYANSQDGSRLFFGLFDSYKN